jgi:hypothetical protein
MATLSLEVYYRYLPLYQQERSPELLTERPGGVPFAR